MNPALVVAIFITYAIIDALYAHWVMAIGDRRAMAASSYAAAMWVLLAFGVINYVNNFAYVIPMAAGSFVGTYAVMAHQKKKESQ